MHKSLEEANWFALKDGTVTTIDTDEHTLKVYDCGKLAVPSGKLICSDPFVELKYEGNDYVNVPSGSYPVYVTCSFMKDLSGKGYDNYREAYASIVFGDIETEVTRRFLSPGPNGNNLEEEAKIGSAYHGTVFVDAGTASFVDAEAIQKGMPKILNTWTNIFDNAAEDSWFSQMDNSTNVRAGIANIKLPLDNSLNLVLFHSGWGDGAYPVVGGYDKDEQLVAVHIDFGICYAGDEEEVENIEEDEEVEDVEVEVVKTEGDDVVVE